ncbi:ATP-binding protein [Myxococcota bacterium]|nr:ATP-binding protein [Myxococcota bacterium]
MTKTRAPIVARTARLTMLGAISQPIGALALVAGSHALGGPPWVPILFGAFATFATSYIWAERVRYGAPRPGGFFVMMCAGVTLAVFACGLLGSPVLFALGTLPVGSAALGPSLAYARKLQVWMLGVLALATILHVAGSPLAELPPFVDRETRGAGLWIATMLAFAVILTGVALGGLASRQLRFAIEDAEASAAQARAEHLASLEARTRDVMLLAGTLADELRDPLREVRATAEVIRARATQPALRERLGVLLTELDRVERRLVHHQTFARPAVAPSRVDAAEVLRSLAGTVEGLATAKDVRVEQRLETEGGDSIENALVLETDEEKLIEILENLAQNAIEASPEGGRVVLRATVLPEMVRFEVLDDGPGLGDSQEKLFVPGFTTKAQGSGLGLVLSRSLAAQLGGKLELDTRPEGGCRARLGLPKTIRA